MLPNFFIPIFKLLIGTSLSMTIGTFWYSKSMFALYWTNSLNSDHETKKKILQGDHQKTLIIELLSRFTKAYFFFYLSQYFTISNECVGDSLNFAFWIFIGFIVPNIVSKANWEVKTSDYILISIGEEFFSVVGLAFVNCYI